MMPAAMMGVHIICTAQTLRPRAPNKYKLTISIKPTPCQE